MLKRAVFVSLVAVLIGIFPAFSLAQDPSSTTTDTNDATNEETQPIQADAGGDRNGLVGQELSFVGEILNADLNDQLFYQWNFGDNTGIFTGEEVNHVFRRQGEYSVSLSITAGEKIVSDQITINIFERSAILITDNSTSEDEVNELLRQAEREGTLLVLVEDRESTTDFVREDTLASLLQDQSENIRRAFLIIDWTSGDTGLNALSKLAQKITDLDELRMDNKAIISTAEPFAVISRIAQGTFDILHPRYILLTSSSALGAVLRSREADEATSNVQNIGAEFNLIGTFSERAIEDLTPLNLMSFLVNFMVNRGVPVNTIVLLLMLPIIATVFAFARQVIGLRAFGIYIPTIVTLSFLALGLLYGLTVFFVVLVVGTLFRLILRRVRLGYSPRVAIVLTMVAFAIMGLLAAGAFTNQTTFVALAIFPILIMVALAEEFVSAQIEQGFTSAVILITETLILAVAAYLLVSWDTFQSLMLAYPELILLTLVINVLLGRWTGLRLMEYYRFRQVRRFAKLP